jgi:hypothetical protein
VLTGVDDGPSSEYPDFVTAALGACRVTRTARVPPAPVLTNRVTWCVVVALDAPATVLALVPGCTRYCGPPPPAGGRWIVGTAIRGKRARSTVRFGIDAGTVDVASAALSPAANEPAYGTHIASIPRIATQKRCLRLPSPLRPTVPSEPDERAPARAAVIPLRTERPQFVEPQSLCRDWMVSRPRALPARDAAAKFPHSEPHVKNRRID